MSREKYFTHIPSIPIAAIPLLVVVTHAQQSLLGPAAGRSKGHDQDGSDPWSDVEPIDMPETV